MLVPELWASEKEFISTMNLRTDPKAPRFKFNLTKHVPDIEHKKLRALLDECKLLMLEVIFESLSHLKTPLHIDYFADCQLCSINKQIHCSSPQRMSEWLRIVHANRKRKRH